MQTYFMDSRSIIAAEMVEAASHSDAAESRCARAGLLSLVRES